MGNLLKVCDEYFRCSSKLRPVLHSKSGSLNEAEFGVYEYTFLHEMLFHYFWRLFLKEAFFKFLPKMLLGKTLCKLLQIFPPKVLVYMRNIFLNTIENCLRQIKWFVQYETFVTYWVYIEGQ